MYYNLGIGYDPGFWYLVVCFAGMGCLGFWVLLVVVWVAFWV